MAGGAHKPARAPLRLVSEAGQDGAPRVPGGERGGSLPSSALPCPQATAERAGPGLSAVVKLFLQGA